MGLSGLADFRVTQGSVDGIVNLSGLAMLSGYSGFGLDRFYCIQKEERKWKTQMQRLLNVVAKYANPSKDEQYILLQQLQILQMSSLTSKEQRGSLKKRHNQVFRITTLQYYFERASYIPPLGRILDRYVK